MTIRTLEDAKAQARALRQALAEEGTKIGHAQALERIARLNGARNWNVLHARLSQAEPEPLTMDQRVTGQYLGQPFAGRIVALEGAGQGYALTVRFDEPVDVVRSPAFQNLRRQVRATVDAWGRSADMTSDGVPQMVLDVAAKV
ncbi:glyoxalase superfamily protein [Chachezhania sediminis]|uniref:glyoxalase superfamily protein n=1 Tax=Chachezhania sediminis TaxID=2599291 RepID=UPI00131B6564|nr:glyoxalase superfamily protein [Chachezhania sediminis]